MLPTEAKPLTLSISGINNYRTCPRMDYYDRVERLVPIVTSPKLTFGMGMHKGLEAYYSHGEAAALLAYDTWYTKQIMWLTEHNGDLQEAQKAATMGRALLTEYIGYAKKHDDFNIAIINGDPAVEQRFRIELWDNAPVFEPPVYLDGVFDAVVEDKYGMLWIMEHKTAQYFPSEFSLWLDWQITAYIMAGRQLFGDRLKGVVYNVIRKVDPKRAKTDVISRKLVTRTNTELHAGWEQIKRKAREMLEDPYRDPNPGVHCNWRCAYQQLCLCEQDGTNKEVLIANHYTRREVKENDDRTYSIAEED